MAGEAQAIIIDDVCERWEYDGDPKMLDAGCN